MFLLIHVNVFVFLSLRGRNQGLEAKTEGRTTSGISEGSRVVLKTREQREQPAYIAPTALTEIGVVIYASSVKSILSSPYVDPGLRNG